MAEPPASIDHEDDRGLVELGQWPRVQAQVLRRRLETAGVSVMIEWSGPWSVPNGAVVFDGERSAARRSLRGLGLPCNETYLPPYCDEVISDAAG